MSTNYNSSVAGTPYVRVCNIIIQYPENGAPTVTLTQELAVVLVDGTVGSLGPFQSIVFNPDMINDATTPIPLVDPTTGADLGANTTLQQTMLSILAVVRKQQLSSNP